MTKKLSCPRRRETILGLALKEVKYAHNARFFSADHPKITTGVLTINAINGKLDEFAQLCKNTFSSTYPSLFTSDTIESIYKDFRHIQLPNELQSNNCHYLYASCNGKYVGYAKLNISDSSEAHLEKIYVSNEYKGQGIGLQLMTEAIQMTVKHQKTSLSLFVWENNSSAIGKLQGCALSVERTTYLNAANLEDVMR